MVSKLHELHREVDARTGPLTHLHKNRLQCKKGCFDCCVDHLTVFEIEAERIKRGSPHVLTMTPHPEGKCAFLNSHGACRVYENRPYVCRTQGFPLRWLEEDEEEDALLEYRDICPLNEEGDPLVELAEEHCWTLGAVEGQLASLQIEFGGPALKRVALRDLFHKPSGS